MVENTNQKEMSLYILSNKNTLYRSMQTLFLRYTLLYKYAFVVLFLQIFACSKNKNVATQQQEITIPKDTAVVIPPYFSVKMTNGVHFSNENLDLGKKKLFVFTNSECMACQALYPELDVFQNRYIETFDVYVFQIGTTFHENKAFIDQYKYRFVMLEGDENLFVNFQINLTPTLFVLNENNHLTAMGSAKTQNDIEALILTQQVFFD